MSLKNLFQKCDSKRDQEICMNNNELTGKEAARAT